jgi:hypothetical protein
MTLKQSMFVVAVLLLCATQKSFAVANPHPDFLQHLLARMNEHRARHGVPPLKLSAALNQYAEERVSTVSQQEGLAAGHAGLKSGYGENLFWSRSGQTVMYGATFIIDSWYAEQSDYKGDYSTDSERFSQLIWKDTTEVGCARIGKQFATYYATYAVCVFTPRGNVKGHFPPSVPPVKK